MEVGYKIVPGAISPDLANFIYNYFILKRRAVRWLIENHPKVKDGGPLYGTWKDRQALNTYSVYGDHVGDTLLMKLLPTMQNFT